MIDSDFAYRKAAESLESARVNVYSTTGSVERLINIADLWIRMANLLDSRGRAVAVAEDDADSD